MRGLPLLEALERHQPGAREHAEATAVYAFAASVELGHDRTRVELVREAAKLHEVGKVYVAAELLAKPATELSAGERAEVEGHHEAGYRLARGAGIPDQICGWILRCRERFDGSGPERLAGDAVPVESRILAAACACHTALAKDGGPEAPNERAVADLRSRSGGELDPRVVDALIAVLEQARR